MERDNNLQKKRKSSRKGRLEAVLLLLSVAATGIAGFLYELDLYETVRILIFAVIGSGCVMFAMEESFRQNTFLFDNKEHLWRFIFLYTIFLMAAMLFPMLPSGGWPCLVIFVGLMLFSNQLIGMCAGSSLLFIAVLLGKMNTAEVFFIYFISGMVGIFVFSWLSEGFKTARPLLTALLIQMVCLCVKEVLMVNEPLSLQLFLIPVINSLICLILLLILLKFFSVSIVYKNRDLYVDINDPECPLLVELKNHSKEEYYHAIHTAYLCDRIAKRLSIDEDTAKAGGYYHKIGILKGENSWETTAQILEEYHFPEKVCTVLKEYLSRNEKIISKETVVLLISDTLISSIEYLFSKDKQVTLDYEKLIDAVYQKKVESGLLNASRITMGELHEMRKILLEEKLYYDFLR